MRQLRLIPPETVHSERRWTTTTLRGASWCAAIDAVDVLALQGR
ncbi:hypothetical protein [uncultured Pseudokineococcus sp.]|nr:hypothetical protein [uncultured Pseudokineococcus sp.]